MLDRHGLKHWHDYTLEDLDDLRRHRQRTGAVAALARASGINPTTLYTRLAGRALSDLSAAELAKLTKPARRPMRKRRR
jgi:hypothetical protein